MALISFGWTTAAFCNRAKNVTRRNWSPEYADTMAIGNYINAFDRQPNYGGKQIGIVRLTATPYLEDIQDMPEVDYAGEGFEFYDQHPELTPKKFLQVFQETGSKNFREYFDFARSDRGASLWGKSSLYVVRFEIVTLTSHASTCKLKELSHG
mgnify:CR=1 FL=1